MCFLKSNTVMPDCLVATQANAPLPSLCPSPPSLNVKTVCLCACILGNLPPTKERALPSAWEKSGVMERKSKGEGDGKLAEQLNKKAGRREESPRSW